jgi:hypothetical protein
MIARAPRRHSHRQGGQKDCCGYIRIINLISSTANRPNRAVADYLACKVSVTP